MPDFSRNSGVNSVVLGKSRRKREKILDFVSQTRVKSHQQKTFRRFVGGAERYFRLPIKIRGGIAPSSPRGSDVYALPRPRHSCTCTSPYSRLQLVLALVFVRALILSYTAVQRHEIFRTSDFDVQIFHSVAQQLLLVSTIMCDTGVHVVHGVPLHCLSVKVRVLIVCMFFDLVN